MEHLQDIKPGSRPGAVHGAQVAKTASASRKVTATASAELVL